MKPILLFIFFVSSIILASIGIEDGINLAILAGLFFAVLTLILALQVFKPVN